MAYPVVSVIIVTHNSQEYLVKCLRSVFSMRYKPLEVIVVDNASTDRTKRILRKYEKKAKLLYLESNLGYAEANNIAAEISGGKYIFLLNPDTVIEPRTLFPLVQEMETERKVGACQPTVLLYKSADLNLTGKEVHFLGFDWIRDYKKKKTPPKGEIHSITGSAVLLRKSALKHTGLFDPTYFMYYEDSDLAWRLRMLGYEMVYVPESIVRHDYKLFPKGSVDAFFRKLFFLERNRLMNVVKNYEFKTLVLLAPVFISAELGLLCVAARQKWLHVKLRSYTSFFQQIPHILKTRSFLQKKRKRTDAQLQHGFRSVISTQLFQSRLVRYIANPFFSAYWSLVRRFI